MPGCATDLRDVSARTSWNKELAGRRLREGRYLRGAFYLGSKDFYAWLRGLRGDAFDGLSMTRVSDINQLYGGRENLDALQRRDARFFNTCMMATALGAAVSDALDTGQVVSGVGGQYNFVAMAHALDGGRSILLLRSSRASHGESHSNILWNYGHTTIPRHLRDIFVTEYGIADLRGKSDEDCVLAMLAITDTRFQDELTARAKTDWQAASRFFAIPDRLARTIRRCPSGAGAETDAGAWTVSGVPVRLGLQRRRTGSPFACLAAVAAGICDQVALGRLFCFLLCQTVPSWRKRSPCSGVWTLTGRAEPERMDITAPGIAGHCATKPRNTTVIRHFFGRIGRRVRSDTVSYF